MSYISVDFISLEAQIKRLEKYREHIEEICERTGYVFRSIEDMQLGDTADELIHALHLLGDMADRLTDEIAALKKVCRLYEECENRITAAVADLPCSFVGYGRKAGTETKYSRNVSASYNGLWEKKTGGFSGHTVINDEWLDELIFG